MKKINKKYLPKGLSKKDRKKQLFMLKKSTRMYKQKKYFTRKKVKSFKSKPSGHVARAMKIYNIKNMTPNQQLAKKTGCTVKTLKKIINKGMGAYYSSGSRPGSRLLAITGVHRVRYITNTNGQ